MINKVYDNIVKIIRENIKFIIFMIILFLVFTYQLPYYIQAPGGVINVSNRVTLEEMYEVEGQFKMAYVLSIEATLPTLIIAHFNNNWDIFKEEAVVRDEKEEFVNKILLEEANTNAVIVAYNKALEEVIISDEKVYVTHIFEEANTTLELGEQILAVDDILIDNKEHLFEVLSNYQLGDTIKIKTNNGVKESTLIESNDRVIIGIQVAETKNIETTNKIEFDFKSSESGPSGGLIMSLSIYNYLIEEDITKGLNIVGTGTIDEFGNVGAIGGVEYKIKAAIKNDADFFFLPLSNYEEANEVVTNEKLDIKLVPVSTIDEALEYLRQ